MILISSKIAQITGILLWEIYSLGKIPYCGVNSFSVLHSWLSEGNRLWKPEQADTDIYESMLECWEEEPESRPVIL